MKARILDGTDNFKSSTVHGVKGGINSGVSYHLDSVTTLKGCQDCDKALFANMKIDGKAYTPPTSLPNAKPEDSDFHVQVNTHSGFMVKSVKKTTTYIVLDSSKLLPFYSIALPQKTLVPIYDMEETVMVGEPEINAKFDFISTINRQQNAYTIAFWIVGPIFILFGIVAHVVYMQRKRRAGPASGYKSVQI